MLRVFSSTHIQPLADQLADVLKQPTNDAMTPEWIAVPSSGMERWLKLELSKKLGTGPLGTDGIAANIDFAFPGSLRSQVLRSSADPDPWNLEHLVWSVLSVLTSSDDPELTAVQQLPPGASWFSRARRIADLFDRYSYHRPRMLTDWVNGKWSDGSGGEVPAHLRWQPVLWRLVRDRIGQPSPPEKLGGRLAELREDPSVITLPSRIAIFGVSTLPGGPQFLELLNAVGVHREVGLYLCDPSVAAADSIAARVASNPLVGGTRADDQSSDAIVNPLLRSWGRPTREAQVQIAHAVQHEGIAPVERLHFESAAPASLLARMQADIVINSAPSGTFVPSQKDNSVQVHSCHGASRQVEVLREVILGLMKDDSSISEDDVVVVVPDLVSFAPLISAVFGTPASMDSLTQPDPVKPPSLRYRITDRSLRSSYPLLNTTALVFELISGRFGASEVLDFCALSPVREKFGFSDEELAEIARWVDGANIRWGLDGKHRERWGMPADFAANSWRAGLDQLLMGVAVHDDEPALGPDDVPPLGVEGSSVAVLGRLAELLSVLGRLSGAASKSRTVSQWCTLTAEVMGQISEVPWSEQWQQQRLSKVLDNIGRDEAVAAEATRAASSLLTLGDFRRVLAEYLTPPAARTGFFEGGITVTSLQPMRWLPHKVVCLLGADQSVFGSTAVFGDDLVASAARVGDPDPRGESRQAMLETLMSASQHFVVTRTGRDLKLNAPVPPAVPVIELLETARATLSPDHQAMRLETVHPRQANDSKNFEADSGISLPNSGRPFSFDPRGLEASQARRSRFSERQDFLAEPLPPLTVDSLNLEELQAFMRGPVRYFFNHRLNVVLSGANDSKPDHLPVELDNLERWQLGTDLIQAGLSKANAKRYIRIQMARGALPPGTLGDAAVEDLEQLVASMFASMKSRGVQLQAEPFEINAFVDGVRLGGQVKSWSDGPYPGPLSVTYSAPDGRHKMDLWLSLMAMAATDPVRDWKALGVARDKGKVEETTFAVKGSDPSERQTHAKAGLAVAIDLYKRGLCEPLPLFAKTSYLISERKSITGIWETSNFSERSGAYDFEVYGHVDAVSLLSMPLRGDEPFGVGEDRARRFANVLWDAQRITTVPVAVLNNSGIGD